MDTTLRQALRNVQADNSPENRAAYRAARARAGLKALPPHSWEHQRKRLMSIAGSEDHWDDIRWSEGYASRADGHDDAHGILIANWNCDYVHAPGQPVEKVRTFNSWLSDMFDRLPSAERPALEWQDTTAECGGCNKIISTGHHYMSDDPSERYLIVRSDILCRACVDSDPRDAIEARKRDGDPIPDWMSSVDCDECDGSGMGPEEEEDCPDCRGSGFYHESIQDIKDAAEQAAEEKRIQERQERIARNVR